MRVKMASVSCMCASSGSCQYVDLFPPPSVRVDMVEKKLGSEQVLWRGKGSVCAVGIFIWFGQNFLTQVSSSLELASLVLRKGNTLWTLKPPHDRSNPFYSETLKCDLHQLARQLQNQPFKNCPLEGVEHHKCLLCCPAAFKRENKAQMQIPRPYLTFSPMLFLSKFHRLFL